MSTKSTFAVNDAVGIVGNESETFIIKAVARGWVTLNDGSKHRAKDLEPLEQGAPSAKGKFGSVIPPAVKRTYSKYKRGKSKSVDNADPVAVMLRTMELAKIYKLAEACSGEQLIGRYDHLNVGMQRMNLGNRIRSSTGGDSKLINEAKKVAGV